MMGSTNGMDRSERTIATAPPSIGCPSLSTLGLAGCRWIYFTVLLRESASRFARRRIRRDRNHVVNRELLDGLLHQRRPRSFARSLLHVKQLPHRVARRSSRKRRYGTETLEIVSVASTARPSLHHRLAFFDAAAWH